MSPKTICKDGFNALIVWFFVWSETDSHVEWLPTFSGPRPAGTAGMHSTPTYAELQPILKHSSPGLQPLSELSLLIKIGIRMYKQRSA